jgi:hypothetical protein
VGEPGAGADRADRRARPRPAPEGGRLTMTLPSRLEMVEEFADRPRSPAKALPGQSSRDLEAVIKETPHAREEGEAP